MLAGGAWVEVKDHHRGLVDVRGERQGGVDLQRCKVGQPGQGGKVVDEQEVDVATIMPAPYRRRFHPLRPMLGSVFLIEVLSVDAIGIALHGDRATPQMRQQGRGDARVVVDHLPLGEAGSGIEDLVEIGQAESLTFDIDDRGIPHAASLEKHVSAAKVYRPHDSDAARPRVSLVRASPARGRPANEHRRTSHDPV